MKSSLSFLVSVLPLAVSAAVRTDDAPARASLQATKAAIAVDCGNPSARVRTIADGLKLIGDARPATLLVTGTCHENVVIDSLDRVTMQGNPTATIDGGTDPNLVTVTISDSKSIQLTSVTVTGGGQGVACINQSLCRLDGLTIKNSLGDGVFIGIRSHANIAETVIQSNGDAGLRVGGGGAANIGDVSIVANAGSGIVLGLGGGFLAVSGGTVAGNGGNGINTNVASFVFIGSATVTGNAGDGLALRLGSTARIADTTFSSNEGHQIRIGDLSAVRFEGANAISGATFPDVLCDPVFSATRGFGTLVGTTTNCPAELDPNP